MARYTDDSVDRVRDAIDMIDLVGSRTELRKAGAARFEGLCPFHDERTPSFGIDPVKKLYHCFGCGVGGDGIKFVQELDGLQFVEAIELLADRYGVELVPAEVDPREAERRARQDRLFKLLDRTTAYYERVLWESPEAEAARSYLLGRGLTEEALREFRVGYSPSAWDRVLMASRKAGFSNQELFDAGLAKRNREGRLYDQFRARIMFPLADVRGRVVGFGARAMSDGRGPKYLNTSENELFHKGRQVYAAHLARSVAAREGRVIVVEGYTDVIALWQAGFPNSVAIMGTSLTEPQVDVLRRLAPVALLALDADNAGQEAMLRAARVAAGKNLELRVVPLPVGSDPADLVADRGADGMKELLGRSAPFVRFRVERELASGDVVTAEGKDTILEALRPVFAGLPASVLREELVRMVADRLDIDASLASSLLAQRGGGGGSSRASTSSSHGEDPGGDGPPPYGELRRPGRPPAADVLGRTDEVERRFLAFCISLPTSGREALAAVDPAEHFTSPVLGRAAVHLRDHLDDPTAEVPADDEELAALLPELVARSSAEPASRDSIDAQRLQLEYRRLQRRMRAARAAGEPVMDLAIKEADLKRELEDAIGRSVESA